MISMILQVNELRITVLTQISTAALKKNHQASNAAFIMPEFSEITIC